MVEQSGMSTGEFWGAIAAGAAALAVVGGSLSWVVRVTIKASFSDMAKGFASCEFVDERIKTHEQIHHRG